MLRWAVQVYDGPVAIRYPRGADKSYLDSAWESEDNTVVCHRAGEDVALVTYGSMLENAVEAACMLQNEDISVAVYRLMCLSDLPCEELARILQAKRVIVVEEVAANSGIYQDLAYKLRHIAPEFFVYGMDLGGRYVPHGSVDALYQHCMIDSLSIAKKIKEVLGREN